MANTFANHLRLFSDLAHGEGRREPELADPVDRLCRAFTAATRWKLECLSGTEPAPGRSSHIAWTAPVTPTGKASRRWQLSGVANAGASATSPVAEEEARNLASALADIVAELMRTQRALNEREAELAAGVPLIPHPKAERHLAERLEAVLQSAAQAVGCRAAGIYLLDAGTSELKVRAQWNLPAERYLDAPRPLRGAMADLEALAGHAVALEDATLFDHWNLPEPNFEAAICVPIASPMELLGTLWVFADEKRAFTDQEVNLVEICAGRVAADLEREILMTETHDTARLKRHWDDAAERRKTRVPQVAPLVDGWEIAGWSSPAEESLGEFHDWLVTRDGALAAAVGRVEDSHFAAALSVEALRSAWRAHAHHEPDMGRLLSLVNDDLWSGSAETVPAHLIGLHLIDDGRITWASAGRTSGLLLQLQAGDRRTAADTAITSGGILLPGKPAITDLTAFGDAARYFGDTLSLGIESDVRYEACARRLLPGDILVLTNSAAQAEALTTAARAGKLPGVGRRSCREWLEAFRLLLHSTDELLRPAALVVVRRTR
ncbi:MAG: GAF domain-containing protein [Planctomycetia bacterium]|nr:GAF domain-containing protein [Planctomycetia bacterium]